MQVELVSPEKVVFSGEATQVITRTLGGGEIAFLPGHAPYLGALSENHTRVFLVDGSTVDLAVHAGFVEVSNSKVSILSDVAEVFTGVNGETVPVAETVESFEAIVNGELDEVPEQAFLNVGGVEQVLAKAKSFQEG